MITKFISAIYFDLYGTELGGRSGRNDHYLYSLNSIMGMTDAKYIVYTNDKSRIYEFYSQHYPDKINQLSVIEYDLYNNYFRDKINKLKDKEQAKKSDRCIELQYSKFIWTLNHSYDCDFIYWIDAGLCHSGLIPDKYLKIHTGRYHDSYYGSDIFANNFLNNLNFLSDQKVLVCAKDNVRNYWDSSIPSKYFNNSIALSDKHIIGGLFGGNTNLTKYLCEQFILLADLVLDTEDRLYSEEQIFSCLYYKYPDIFNPHTFDIWWHENNVAGAVGVEAGKELLNNNKSFYKILENILYYQK
jgi:hypothetical protein